VLRKQVHHAIWDRPELADTARGYQLKAGQFDPGSAGVLADAFKRPV